MLNIHPMKDLWMCWTNNCRGRGDDQLYIFHVAFGDSNRTLCGSLIQETGEAFTDLSHVGCLKCTRMIKNMRAHIAENSKPYSKPNELLRHN